MWIAAVMLLLMGAPALPAQSSPNSDFQQGQQLFTANKFPEALAAFDRAAAAEPKRAEIHLARCRTLAALRKFDDAFAACDRSLMLEPNNAEALRDLGHYKLNMGRVDDAQRNLEKAESLNKSDRNIYYHLGLTHYFKGEFRQSAEQFQGCLNNSKEKTDQIECDAWLYPSLVRAGQNEEASKLLAGVAPDPSITGHPGWYFDRLLLFKGLKTEDQVAANLNAEGALSMESIGYSIGVWHLLNGREAKAREYFQKILTGDVPYAWGYRAAQAELKRMGLPSIIAVPGSGSQTAARTYQVGAGVTAPIAISHTEPKYTDEARKAKLEGIVVLRCVVTEEGEVKDIRVSRSLGKGLDAKAIEAVQQWKFQPATKDGVPVPVQIAVQVNFRLY